MKALYFMAAGAGIVSVASMAAAASQSETGAKVSAALNPIETGKGDLWTTATNGVVFGTLAFVAKEKAPLAGYAGIAALLVYGYSKGLNRPASDQISAAVEPV